MMFVCDHDGLVIDTPDNMCVCVCVLMMGW